VTEVLLCFAKVFWLVSRVLLWCSKLLLVHCSASQGVLGGFLGRDVACVLLSCSWVLGVARVVAVVAWVLLRCSGGVSGVFWVVDIVIGVLLCFAKVFWVVSGVFWVVDMVFGVVAWMLLWCFG